MVFFVLLNFNKEYGVKSNEEQVDVDPDSDEEDTEGVKLDNKSERHWRVFSRKIMEG